MQTQTEEDDQSMDSSNVFDKAKKNLNVIKEHKVKRTRDGFVTKEFQNAALMLNNCQTFIGQNISSCENSDMIKKLTKLSKEYQVVEIYCQICAEILKSGENSEYPGIKPEHTDSLDAMLSFLMNSSDDNEALSVIISRETSFLAVSTRKLEEWSTIVGKIEMKLKERSILETLCGVLYNISIFEDNVPYVRNAKCIEAMKLYVESENNNNIRLLCLAALAYLVKESECGILRSKSDIITFLMSTISKALKTRSYDGWSIKELARIVQQLARNDNNKRMIVLHGAVPLLVKIIDDGSIEEQRAAVDALWALSFDKETRKDMIENQEWKVMSTLERLSRSSDKIVETTAKKALWTINDHKNSCDKHDHDDDKVTRSVERHILISYNWGNQDRVKKISVGLKKNCFRVWMDEDNIKGSPVDTMSEAVDQADIVLVCYSYKYKNSDNCRVEAEYAWQQGKEIILLKMDSEYEADGWLEPMINSNLHYDFSGNYPGEKKVNEVIGAIQKELNRKNGVAVDVAKTNIESDNKVIIAEQPHRQKIDKIADVPVLWILVGLFFILFLLLCLLINVACFYSSNNVCSYKECEPNSQTAVPGTLDEKPKENQTDGLTSTMNWTLSQVEEWLNAKIIRKDMFLSTQKQLKTLRGKDIAFLKLLVHECPITFYQMIREQFGMKDIQSMSDFRFAFENIDTTVIDTDLHSSSKQFTSTSTRTVETTKVRLTV